MEPSTAPRWYDADAKVIEAGHQPACLVDLALCRGIDSHRLMRGSGLFYDDLLAPGAMISANQYMRLIDNARQLLDADDSSFLLGQRLLPGHFGACSNVLLHADTLLQALHQLVNFRVLLCPLLAPRLVVDEHHAYVYWVDALALGRSRQFLFEASMTAVTALTRTLSGESLPWEYRMAWTAPRHVEQYWVHMGERLRFDAPITCMRLPREVLVRAPLSASPMLARIAEQQAMLAISTLPGEGTLSEVVFDCLYRNARKRQGLDQVADCFGMSAATFKRRLQREGTGYQELLDRAHTQIALELYQGRGCSHDQVAESMQISDRTNFRRLLKRLTGKSPDSLRVWLES
ncbi:AraC family transcriptional regulator ligand-binding domain-containing protein [Halopseudomonas sp.]|jgi:AraC-like DNA-binding protein|uniref:AraC family transcriptional regulator ligand-binding domain-containing protein n=1 Tax=Halopseudomonas sp. TaxID=2901191 RepID=UPI00311E129F